MTGASRAKATITKTKKTTSITLTVTCASCREESPKIQAYDWGTAINKLQRKGWWPDKGGDYYCTNCFQEKG